MLKVKQYSSSEQIVPELQGVAICDRTVLPSTWHKWTHPA